MTVEGGSAHLSAAMFAVMAGVKMTPIPYKNTGTAITDLISGQVQLFFSASGPVMPHVKAGKLKALGITSARKSALLPDLPTIAESGLPGFNSSTWFGIVGPGGMPRPIVDKLAAALKSALEDPQVNELVRKLGAEPQFMAPRAFDDFMKSERVKWDATVKASGAKVG